NIPVLPVVLSGHQYLLPKGAVMPTAVYQPIRMKVLEPIDPQGFSTARALSNRVHQTMTEALEEIRVLPGVLARRAPQLEERT
ncbi:MAG: hypothetical protein JRJ84_21345, partial [Deltaproteobacteria bacterium]|nr:hypothetical protein [Deltaproteobacteria bacterium]